MMNDKQKFYNANWFLWLALILFAPVGIFLMWKNKKFSKKVRGILSGVFALWFLIIASSGNGSSNSIQTINNKAVANKVTESKNNENQNSTIPVAESNNNDNKVTSKETSSDIISNSTIVNGQLKVHYINVGQGDSILVQQGSQNMLIDTGTNASTSSLMGYLQSQNIKKIDYLILTHPHEDHIGGADVVIQSLDIGTIYMPKITTTTKTFKDVVNAMNSKGLKVTTPLVGSTFKLGGANCTILGPINSNKDDLNTYSIVLKLQFGNNKFLFTGDAQTSNEQDMINKGLDLSADVLKVGHHGSHTSTSQAFLDKVNPKYAVISVGKGNDYGHPHQEVMQRLQAKGVQVYRTDENGNIIATSDGKNITFNTNTGSYSYAGTGSSSTNTASSNSSSSNIQTNIPSTTSSGEKQYVDTNGNGLIKGSQTGIYHIPGDLYYSKTTNVKAWFKTVSEAEKAGYRAPKK